MILDIQLLHIQKKYDSWVMLLIPKRIFLRQTVHRMTFPRTIQKYYFVINLFNVNEMWKFAMKNLQIYIKITPICGMLTKVNNIKTIFFFLAVLLMRSFFILIQNKFCSLQIFRSRFGSIFCASNFAITFSQYFTQQPLIKLLLN